ncbi:MAG: prenyltransferase/squalene oxidase repeat-containing protein [Planctomycetaceae bacterium]|nr:terpene cyclase/mutase family protein [Planctomycetaceae bacterium]
MNRHTRQIALLLVAVIGALPAAALAEGTWEVTPESKAALERGIDWLAKNQGPKGNWDNEQMGLVSMGLLAYLSAGHLPGRGKYGRNVQQAMDYLLDNAKPSGLMNIAVRGHDMYNHGLCTFVLGQLYGMTGDKRVGRTLDRALRLIQDAQCADGGWDYVAISKPQGHDLSLTVMQAKALRSAMDCGFKVDPGAIQRAVEFVRRNYRAEFAVGVDDPKLVKQMGMFSYSPGNVRNTSITTTAIGVICLQEFGQYDDPRLAPACLYLRHMVKVGEPIFIKQYADARKMKKETMTVPDNHVPFDAYTLYYLSQALYQRGGEDWKIGYTVLRDQLAKRQRVQPGSPEHGTWQSTVWWMRGKEAQFYGTAIGCFVLAMPNRYLPILQEGRIESLIKTVEGSKTDNP